MDIRFNQDDRFFAHDGIEPAPGDDEPKLHVVEPEEDDDDDDDDDTDEEEDDDESEDDDDDDED